MTTEGLHLKNQNLSELKANDGAPSFEEGLKRLEEIVARMEEGQVSLESSVQLYEEGVVLKKTLQQQLDQAALRVSQLAAPAKTEKG